MSLFYRLLVVTTLMACCLAQEDLQFCHRLNLWCFVQDGPHADCKIWECEGIISQHIFNFEKYKIFIIAKKGYAF